MSKMVKCVAYGGTGIDGFILQNDINGQFNPVYKKNLIKILSDTPGIVDNVKVDSEGNIEVTGENIDVYEKPSYNKIEFKKRCAFFLNNNIYAHSDDGRIDIVYKFNDINIHEMTKSGKRLYIYDNNKYQRKEGAINICTALLKLKRYGNNSQIISIITKRLEEAKKNDRNKNKKENYGTTDQPVHIEETEPSVKDTVEEKIEAGFYKDLYYLEVDYDKLTDEELVTLRDSDKEKVSIFIKGKAGKVYDERHPIDWEEEERNVKQWAIENGFIRDDSKTLDEQFREDFAKVLAEVQKQDAEKKGQTAPEEPERTEEEKKAALQDKKEEEKRLSDTKTDDKEKFIIAIAYSTNSMVVNRIYLLDIMNGKKDILPVDVIKNNISWGRLRIENLKVDDITQELAGYKDLMKIGERKKYKVVYKRGCKYYISDNEGNCVIKSNDELQTMLKVGNDKFEYSTYLEEMLHEDEKDNSDIQPDPDCELCHGTGEYVPPDMIKFAPILDKTCRCIKQQINNRSTLKQVRAAIKYHVTKIESNEAVEKGLIPEYRWEDEWDKDILQKDIVEMGKLYGYKLSNYKMWSDTLTNILMTISSSLKITESYLIGAPNDYGKAIFAYTCIKRLYALNRRVVPYITLGNLGVLRKEYDRYIAYRAEPKKEFSSENKYTWDDYVKAEIAFVSFTDVSRGWLEWNVLNSLISERSLNALPTIVFTRNSIELYKKDKDLKRQYIDELVAHNSRASKYDKLTYIAVYKSYRQ